MKKRTFLDTFTFGSLKPAQQIVLSFAGVILTGGILLSLPISNQSTAAVVPFLDHLFTATSAVCVTGLTTIIPATQYTLFGQIVIIFLMQIGGLGLMTMIAAFVIYLGNKMTLSDRLSILEATNRAGFHDFKKFVLNIIKYTFIFEFVGFLIMLFQLVPEYGLWDGMFKSLFTAVSAFCNAGIDVFGSTSMIQYVSNPVMSLTVSALIVMGGLGFGVWFDLSQASKSILRKKLDARNIIHHLRVHTKLAVFMTVILIASGMLLIFGIEFTNPDSLAPLDFGSKLMSSLFQSVTLRTAGFATLNIGLLRPATQMIMIVYMFIGGSPGGTAGGIKTTTFAILILMIFAELRSQKNIIVFGRTIERELFRKAFIIFFILLSTLFIGILLLSLTEPFDALAIVFEATSAIATVGLSMGITASLSDFGKIVIIALMYLGRIGPLTLLLSIGNHTKHIKTNGMTFPSANILIG
ncbi:MAG: potassium transporter [Erysipelotrichaceae bacterium]|nr:MAG: potassium [Erysipelotrichaceae bacterium]TXT17401.1 MAG: potassium transporter [Erysipelotrichaceae bacterium]